MGGGGCYFAIILPQNTYKHLWTDKPKLFGGHEYFLWVNWYPCFGLLVMTPLCFKARVGSALFTLGRGVRVTRSLRLTPGATPADLLVDSMAAEPISSTYLWNSLSFDVNRNSLCLFWDIDRQSLWVKPGNFPWCGTSTSLRNL